MIQRSGVIFEFTPPISAPRTSPAGNHSGALSAGQPITNFKNKPLQNNVYSPPGAIQQTKHSPQLPRDTYGVKPLRTQPKKPVSWNKPLLYTPPTKPVVPFTKIQNRQALTNTPEFHHGLPVEEIPEIPMELPPPTIDTEYVERLFGTQQPAPQVESEPKNPILQPTELTQQTRTPEKVQHNAGEEIRQEIDTHRQEADSTKHLPTPPLTDKQETATMPSLPKKRSPFDFLKPKFGKKQAVGVLIVAIALYTLAVPLLPKFRLEATYSKLEQAEKERNEKMANKPLPPAIPIGVNPLMAPDGSIVEPINTEFSIVIPAVGINSAVIAGVNPLDPKSYKPALEKGVAHAKTSYLPGGPGTTYLFSHSTNYEWYIKDLNAVFYNVKNLSVGDYILVFYQGNRFVYEYKQQTVVKPNNTSFLVPESGKHSLILQTCWPPGSTTERLLLFADLVQQST